MRNVLRGLVMLYDKKITVSLIRLAVKNVEDAQHLLFPHAVSMILTPKREARNHLGRENYFGDSWEFLYNL